MRNSYIALRSAISFEYKAFLMLNTVVNVNVITVNSNNVKGFHINNNVKEFQITLVNVELKS